MKKSEAKSVREGQGPASFRSRVGAGGSPTPAAPGPVGKATVVVLPIRRALTGRAAVTSSRVASDPSVSARWRSPGRWPGVPSQPAPAGTGEIVRLARTVVDLSEERRSRQELAEALAFRDRVLGILGHDLRNPL